MSNVTERGGFQLFPKMYTSGIAETGLTCVVNDRNTTLTVPWEASTTGSINVIWTIDSDDGDSYTITVPVTVTVSGSTTTASYTEATYTRAVVT